MSLKSVSGSKQIDFNDRLEKLRFSGTIAIQNNTSEKATLIFHSHVSAKNEEIVLSPSEQRTFSQTFDGPVKKITLKKGEGQFLNFLSVEKDNIKCSVDSSERFTPFLEMDPFDFDPFIALENERRKYSEDATRKKDFDRFESWTTSLHHILREEGIRPEDFYSKRKKVYEKNRPIEKSFLSRIDNRVDPRIPPISCHIWVTDPENPRQVSDQTITWAKTVAEKNPGWTHYYVVDKKTSQSKLIHALEDTNIQLIEYTELFPDGLILQKYYDQAVAEKRLALATDILRMEIALKYGGWYFDGDTVCYQNLDFESKLFDLIINLEPFTALFGNAIFANRPNHPVIQKCLELIQRNLDIPDTIRNAMLSATQIAKSDEEISDLLQRLQVLTKGNKKSAKHIAFMLRNIYYMPRFAFYENMLRESLVDDEKLLLDQLREKIYSHPEIKKQLDIIYEQENMSERTAMQIPNVQEIREELRALAFKLVGDQNPNNTHILWIENQLSELIRNSHYPPRFTIYYQRILEAYSGVAEIQGQVLPLLEKLKDSIQSHPDIKRRIEEVEAGTIQIDKRPEYIRTDLDELGRVVLETGPFVLSHAFHLSGDQEENIDLPCPPHYFTPAKEEAYPHFDIVKADDSAPLKARSAHFWASSWMKSENGMG